VPRKARRPSERSGWRQDFPRLQLLSIADLLGGAKIQMPPAYGTFRQAPRVGTGGQQGTLGLDGG
jgi:hypothetical protein